MKKNEEPKRLKLSSLEWETVINNQSFEIKVRTYNSDYSIGEYVECYGCRKESFAKIVDISASNTPFADDSIILTLRLL